jgi:hypothetical protein
VSLQQTNRWTGDTIVYVHEKIELEQKLVRGETKIKEKNELLLIHA